MNGCEDFEHCLKTQYWALNKEDFVDFSHVSNTKSETSEQGRYSNTLQLCDASSICLGNSGERQTNLLAATITMKGNYNFDTFAISTMNKQMGSNMKPTIFSDRVANALRKWHHTARKHVKQARQTASTPGTPSQSMSPAHLLHRYKSEQEMSVLTSPRISSFNDDNAQPGSSRQDEDQIVSEPRSIHDRLGPKVQHEINIQSVDFSFDRSERKWRNHLSRVFILVKW